MLIKIILEIAKIHLSEGSCILGLLLLLPVIMI